MGSRTAIGHAAPRHHALLDSPLKFGLQADRLRDVQSGGVAGRQDRAMLGAPHTGQKLQNLFLSQDNRQLLRFFGCRNYFPSSKPYGA
jgi:hypothetical protein